MTRTIQAAPASAPASERANFVWRRSSTTVGSSRAIQGVAIGTDYDYSSGFGTTAANLYVTRYDKGWGSILQTFDVISDPIVAALSPQADHVGAIGYDADHNEVLVGLLRSTGPGPGAVVRLDGDNLAVKGLWDTAALFGVSAKYLDPVTYDTVTTGGPYVWFATPSYIYRAKRNEDDTLSDAVSWYVMDTYGFAQGFRILSNGNLLATFPFASSAGSGYSDALYEMDVSVVGTMTPIQSWTLQLSGAPHDEGIDLVPPNRIVHAESNYITLCELENFSV